MRPLGYRRNPERRALSYTTRPRLAARGLGSVDLTGFAPPIFDQGATSSCVGHARSRGLYVASAAVGRPLTFVPSPADLYRLARCYERRDWRTPLADIGCDPVDTLDAALQWGVREIGPLASDGRYSDAIPETINDTPNLQSLLAARDTRIADDKQIIPGPAAVDTVVAELYAGHPVCIDVPGGSETWQDYGPASPTLMGSWAPLDHYVVLLAAYADSSGRVSFVGHNSWGHTWGRLGAFVCDETVVMQARDLISCGGALI